MEREVVWGSVWRVQLMWKMARRYAHITIFAPSYLRDQWEKMGACILEMSC